MPPHDVGRKCLIVLLDDSKLETTIQPSTTGGDLLDVVASQYHLREKEYFGLCVDGSESTPQWLELERPVLEQDIPVQGILTLRFQVRYYVETIAWLTDSVAVEMFYLQCKQNVFRGLTVCSSETIFQLAGYVMQATYGDFSLHHVAKEDLKRLPVIPASTLKEHPNTSYCESEIIHIYEYLQSKSRGIAILSYLNTVIQQPTFGLQCYEVTDKADQPFLLGLSPRGLGVYDPSSRSALLHQFEWKNLENIYHRDRKFSIEVFQQPSGQSHVNLRPSSATLGPSQQARGNTPRNLAVHVWYSSNPRLLRSLFNTAKGQHQLYLSKRAARAASPSQCRSPSVLAQELSLSTMSLDSGSNLTGSANSLVSTGSKGPSNTSVMPEEAQAAALAAARLAERDMCLALRARLDMLRQQLSSREEEFGKLSREEERIRSQRALRQAERSTRVVSASYALKDSVVAPSDGQNTKKNQVDELRKSVQIQQSIVKAATKLSQERNLSRNVKKERKDSLRKAEERLRDMHAQLDFLERNHAESSRSLDSGLDGSRDMRSSSPSVASAAISAPSTVSQSPTPSAGELRPQVQFNSQADEDFVAGLISGPDTVLSRSSPAPNAAVGSTGVVARPAPRSKQGFQPGAVGVANVAAPSHLAAPSQLGPQPSIVPIRERLRSLAQKRESFLMADPVQASNGYPSRPDSSSSEEEGDPQPRQRKDVVSWLDDKQLFGPGTLV